MTGIVVDCSVMISWAFEADATPIGLATLGALRDVTAVVPTLWTYEMANIVRKFERRKRFTRRDSDKYLSFIAMLPIRIDDVSTGRALADTLRLAREEDLTAYDASYLELALRENAPLATDDEALRGAAERCGAALIG